MASCLYECLCEAELEKYYPHFIALGFERIDELAKVSMKDYAKLGVHNMKDRKRLFQLVRIIKMLQAEEEAVGKSQPYLQAGAVYLQPPLTRSGPRRQLHFDSPSEERDGGREHESGSCTLSSCSVNEDKDDLAAVLSHDSEYKILRKDSPNAPATWAEYKLGDAAISSSNDIGPLLGDTEAPIVQRIAHVSGYNYGVPHSCIRPADSEKEMPWTETDRICVCVRKRPLGLREERRGEVNILTVEGKETLLLHEKKEAVDLTQYILQHVFYFDEVFGETCSNQDVYMKTAHPLIQHIFNGGNATCFAYGQTGAGKTYTMIGTHQNPGLYALAAKDIFRQLEASQSRQDLHVWISFYEIYCGQLYDLLNGRKRLFAREDSKHVVQIVGLREVQVNTVSLLLEVILKGGKERSTGATGVNSDSSRSHAVIQIQIKDAANRVFGRISFIDLAGSERAADARDSDRQTKMEGAEINQSLLALKECIRALDQEHAHTPFRQSKLTQVLKDSFVGNSKTCMIANVSPSHIATEHTLNTLRYADRVKELKRGMKCCTPVANRRSTTGSTSPKRIQSSPRVQVGEKSSPKKVKLGLQRPPVLTVSSRVKASSLLAHPGQPPFSSTPKGQARKGQIGAQWLSHTSPVKGALRAAKATAEGPTQHAEKSHVGKDLVARKEGGQGDAQQVKGLKAQPVRKQFIPRADFPLGDTQHALAHEGDGGRLFAEQCTAAWTGLPPHHRDREQHLHLYHQQFQQPPLLQQKLNYQPLERFLAQYKPRGLQVKREAPCQTPGSPQHCDATMQLDELDDSDFSDDSFSLGPSQRKAQAEGQGDCSEGSFFLHQRECGADGPEVQGGHELFPELGNKGAALPRGKEAASCEEGTKNRPDWSREEASALESPPQKDTPEKPYCSQGDSAGCNRTNAREPLAGQNPSKFLGLPPSDKHCSMPEKSVQSPSFVGLLGSTKTIADSLAGGSIQGPPSGIAGGKGLQKEAGLSGGQDCSMDFASGAMAPLTATFLDVGTSDTSEEDQSQPWEGKAVLEEEEEEEDSTARKPVSPTKHWDYEDTREFRGNRAPSLASVYERDQWRRNTGQMLSPQARPKWLSQSCRSPKASSPWGVASALNELHGCVCGYSAEDAGLVGLPSPCTDEGSSVRLHNLRFSECVSSPYYDADTEATAIAPLSCSGQFSLGDDDSTKPRMLLKHIDMVEQSFVSSTLSISDHAGRKDSPAESILLQPSLAFGKLELGHAQEACRVTFNGEEMGLLKNRCTQNRFPHPPDAVEQDSGLVSKGISITVAKKSSKACGQTEIPDSSLPFKGTLERQFVLQIHREQLDEMAGLCFQEESLIRKMSALDFEDFVMQLDTILMLKSKCIQKMQSQLQPFLAAASSGAALLTASLT